MDVATFPRPADSELVGTPTAAHAPACSTAAAKSVLLLGVTQNTNNYGVRVLLTSAVSYLRRMHPNATISALDYGQISEEWSVETGEANERVRLINLRFSWKLFLPNNIFSVFAFIALMRLVPVARWRRLLLRQNRSVREILNARRAYALSGGDSFSDIYGMRRLVYVALPQLLVLWLGRPLVLLPQTYGPFRKGVARAVARRIFAGAQQIWSRDRAGIATVRALIGDKKAVRTLPDLGFSMPAAPLAADLCSQFVAWKRERAVVGLNISKLLYMGGYDLRNMFGLRTPHRDFVRSLVQFLCEDLRLFVLLVPHVYGGAESQESEVHLYRRIYPDFAAAHPGRIAFIDRTFTHREIKGVIGACDLFLGGRMHACVASVAQGVPTIPLAYSDKFAGVMELFDASIPVFDLRRGDAASVRPVIKSVLANREEIRRALTRRMKEIFQDTTAALQCQFGAEEDPLSPNNC